MTLPHSRDDDSTPHDASGAPHRPDWLMGMDEDLGQVPEQRRGAPRPPTPIRPVPPPARAPVTPPRPGATDSHPKVEGLVGFEAPKVKAVDEGGDVTHGRESFSTSAPAGDAPHPAAWSAAASSIPALRVTRRRAAAPEEIAPEESWDDAPALRPRVVPHPASAAPFTTQASETDSWSADATPAPHAAPATSMPPITAVRPRSPLETLASQLRDAFTKPWVMIATGAAVAGIVFGVVTTRPKGREYVSIQHVKAHAEELDGHSVNLEGTVGQIFPVGGGFAYYLHQKRDTIVVFTRIRTPVERTRVALAGKVSTGFLDGAPRPAIFESELFAQ